MDKCFSIAKKRKKRLIHIMKDLPYTRTKTLRNIIKLVFFFCSYAKLNSFKGGENINGE